MLKLNITKASKGAIPSRGRAAHPRARNNTSDGSMEVTQTTKTTAREHLPNSTTSQRNDHPTRLKMKVEIAHRRHGKKMTAALP